MLKWKENIMNESPRIITRTRRVEEPQTDAFQFTSKDIPHVADVDLRAYRENAWAEFERQSLPTVREEAWRRTDIRGLKIGSFHLAGSEPAAKLTPVPNELLAPLADEEHGGEVVLTAVDAKSHLNPEVAEQGVIFTDWATAEKNHSALLAKLVGRIVHSDESKFAAMAASLAQTGIFLYVPRGVVVAQPLHSLLWGSGMDLAHVSHLLVWLEEGSSVTYVHEDASGDGLGGQVLHSGMVEIYVGAGAKLTFVELQSWGSNVWNFSNERARVERDGTLDWIFGAIGSHLTKNFTQLDLVGEGSTGRMSGFYFTDGNQHLDHDTQQNHLAKHTTSDLLFKGALEGDSRSVWQGMIYVAPGADKTDGYQANRNLVLSKNARADSIPGLEILADDVRCSHGATVGKVDQEQVFYLLSRGIPRHDAERLIVEGFFDPIMQRIPFEGVRQRFQTAIHNKMVAK